MVFSRTADAISLELLQADKHLALDEPWASMPNTGNW